MHLYLELWIENYVHMAQLQVVLAVQRFTILDYTSENGRLSTAQAGTGLWSVLASLLAHLG